MSNYPPGVNQAVFDHAHRHWDGNGDECPDCGYDSSDCHCDELIAAMCGRH